MKRKDVRTALPEPAGAREKLQSLRSSLLALHKTLLESERVEYERTIGRIQSPNHFLRLLTSDPWFAWLSPLSQLIVAIDEVLEGEGDLTTDGVEARFRESANLLVASDTAPTEFPKHYFEALQRDPDVVLAHAELAKLPGWRKP